MKTAPTIEIEASPTTMVLLVAASLPMTVLCVVVAFHRPPGADDVAAIMLGAIGAALFGLCAAVGAWRLFSARGPVVTIAPEGIRDRRVAGAMVPWSAVGTVFTREDYRHKVMVVAIDPRAAPALTRIGRPAREAERRLRADGLCVTALGLKTTHETLLATTLAYLEAWRSSRRPGAPPR